MSEEFLHIPVLLQEILEIARENLGAVPRPLIVDGTLGEGGHTLAFRRAFPGGRVLSFDRDPEMIHRATRRLAGEGVTVNGDPGTDSVDVVEAPFASMAEYLAENGLSPHLILLDLGVSTHHFLGAARGFSYTDDSLDMRLSPDLPRTAEEIVNTETEEELARIFYEYGEERHSRRLARTIAQARPLKGARELAALILKSLGGRGGRGGIHPATRIFQALRIAVNGELDQLRRALDTLPDLLAPGGVLCIISFHSLEDRMVKHTFRDLGEKLPRNTGREKHYARPRTSDRLFQILTPTPIIPGEEEVKRNAASRSSRLRVLRKKTDIQ